MPITTNRDFLFLYEAKHTNPNGDPDNENKPRMDADTNTNLVTDVRLKRYIRDYFKQQGREIFVDMQGDSKVTMDTRLRGILSNRIEAEGALRRLLTNDEEFLAYEKLAAEAKSTDDLVNRMVSKKPASKQINQAILSALVKEDFIDIRMFGSAFAIDGFSQAVTGPIQLAWGYSLNEVHLLESNTIASIMSGRESSEGNSTFGRDHRVKYSLIAFQGTINAAAARHTGLSEEDIQDFRKAIWAAVAATPSRSKVNQYPLLYVEFEYGDGEPNGSLGDLRQLISCEPVAGKDSRQVDELSDLHLDFSKLQAAYNSSTVAKVYDKAADRLDYAAQTAA